VAVVGGGRIGAACVPVYSHGSGLRARDKRRVGAFIMAAGIRMEITHWVAPSIARRSGINENYTRTGIVVFFSPAHFQFLSLAGGDQRGGSFVGSRAHTAADNNSAVCVGGSRGESDARNGATAITRALITEFLINRPSLRSLFFRSPPPPPPPPIMILHLRLRRSTYYRGRDLAFILHSL
jgi:hypothetical protein